MKDEALKVSEFELRTMSIEQLASFLSQVVVDGLDPELLMEEDRESVIRILQNSSL